jgi:hypothetical protein
MPIEIKSRGKQEKEEEGRTTNVNLSQATVYFINIYFYQ